MLYGTEETRQFKWNGQKKYNKAGSKSRDRFGKSLIFFTRCFEGKKNGEVKPSDREKGHPVAHKREQYMYCRFHSVSQKVYAEVRRPFNKKHGVSFPKVQKKKPECCRLAWKGRSRRSVEGDEYLNKEMDLRETSDPGTIVHTGVNR